MMIETKFDIGQKVMVKALCVHGFIVGIYAEEKNLFYSVTYWFNGEWFKKDFNEREIE